jgi:general secretion pathway protein D
MRNVRASIVWVGLLCCPALPAAESAAPKDDMAQPGSGVDLTRILEDYAKRSNKRLIIDPRVRAFVSAPGIDLQRASFRDLQAILTVHGFVAYEQQGIVVVVPEANMRSLPLINMDTTAASSIGEDDIVLRVVRVEKVEAAQLVPILRPLMPQWAHMAASAPLNSLILVGRYANVRTIESVVRTLEKQPPRTLPMPADTRGTN